jgi:UDP-N-acetyl-2-amino-2-deoxyglucuronate dehydrogenase
VSIRVGILGGGNISETHARAAGEIPGVEVAAFHGQNAVRTERLARRFGAVAYRELDDFTRHPGLDIVLIGSPSGLHLDHATAAARQGLHVLVEKPLEISTKRADALVEACEQAGVKLGVFFQDRTAPDLRWLRELISTGGLGSVLLASARVKWYRPPEYYAESRWRGTWALDGGGALMNQGIHTVDLLLWLIGDVDSVFARARTALHSIEVEDTVVATLEFTGGALATLEATTAAFPGLPRQVEITGANGTVVIQHDRIAGLHLRNPAPDAPPPHQANVNASASSPQVGDVRGHRRVIENLLAAIASGEPLLCSGREGLRSVAVVQAIYRSARTGEAVAVTRGG